MTNFGALLTRLAHARVESSRRVRLMALDDLIRSEAAAGRPQDLLDLEALKAIARLG